MTETSPCEAACRAACECDGFDPNEIVRLTGTYARTVSPLPPGLPPEFGLPRWKAYEHEAHRLNAILEALGRRRTETAEADDIAGPEAIRAAERMRIVAYLRERQDHYIRRLGKLDVPGPFSAQYVTVARELLYLLDLIVPLLAGAKEPLP
jgi:hypothetical protein